MLKHILLHQQVTRVAAILSLVADNNQDHFLARRYSLNGRKQVDSEHGSR